MFLANPNIFRPGFGIVPVIKYDRTFLPVRALIEIMGGNMSWDGTEQKISINLKGKTVNLWIGQPKLSVNGEEQSIDVAPYISQTNRTMLPMRIIGDSTVGRFISQDIYPEEPNNP